MLLIHLVYCFPFCHSIVVNVLQSKLLKDGLLVIAVLQRISDACPDDDSLPYFLRLAEQLLSIHPPMHCIDADSSESVTVFLGFPELANTVNRRHVIEQLPAQLVILTASVVNKLFMFPDLLLSDLSHIQRMQMNRASVAAV